ncbi:MAG: glycoside hydrolase family 88 protein [Opitutaceae bacterium]|jgi:rhamnogalacturonyl hydrolase YesR|nr:glycoside hydrolase family 88 protein [Opitutaceae bacterium]
MKKHPGIRGKTTRRPVAETWRPESQAPAYPWHYGPPAAASIRAALGRIRAMLEKHSPAHLVDCRTGRRITGFSRPRPHADIAQGLFRIISYEWGVVHCGMMLAAENTGDARYRDYTAKRMQLMADATPWFGSFLKTRPDGAGGPAFMTLLHPRSLDDAGSLCAAMAKAHIAGLAKGLPPIINNLIAHIMERQHRAADGAFARNRPVKNSIWLDDLYMSVPALAQMYKLTGRENYAGEAVRQIMLFSKRLHDPATGLFAHGWFEDDTEHPAYHWGRANGWAMLAMVELLDVLPADYPGRDGVLALLQGQIHGVARLQDGTGFWRQLLDRNDSFPETSATALFTYCIARAINRGWCSALARGPAALAGWNAVASRIDARGCVNGTCVGSAMAMDPAYYYHRPQSRLAAHGYGPALLAGAELLPIIESGRVSAYDGAAQFGRMLRED